MLWKIRISASTISDLNQKTYVHIEEIYLMRNWAGEFENVNMLMAIGVDEDGYRKVIGTVEGMKEDKKARGISLDSSNQEGLRESNLLWETRTSVCARQ